MTRTLIIGIEPQRDENKREGVASPDLGTHYVECDMADAETFALFSGDHEAAECQDFDWESDHETLDLAIAALREMAAQALERGEAVLLSPQTPDEIVARIGDIEQMQPDVEE